MLVVSASSSHWAAVTNLASHDLSSLLLVCLFDVCLLVCWFVCLLVSYGANKARGTSSKGRSLHFGCGPVLITSPPCFLFVCFIVCCFVCLFVGWFVTVLIRRGG